MKTISNFLFITLLLLPGFVYAQPCAYTLDKLINIDCYHDNTGEIAISLNNINASHFWVFPDGATSTSLNLMNLKAGDYLLNIIILGDTCTDVVVVEETIRLDLESQIKNICNVQDSADLTITNIWGGTPPYSLLWTATGETSSDVTLAPGIHTVRIQDANNCRRWKDLTVPIYTPINTYMTAEHVKCKDDNSGHARIDIIGGIPPFYFEWGPDTNLILTDSDSLESEITQLLAGYYAVKVIDSWGCEIVDSIEVKFNPAMCLKIYKVFSPNGDGINDFWNLENIHLYPKALIEIYDRNGTSIYRRRNYQNTENIAFKGRDKNNQNLPSGTYYYVIDLENEDKVFRGTLTIVR